MKAILDLDGVCGDYLPWLFRFFARRIGTDPNLWEKTDDPDVVREVLGLEHLDFLHLIDQFNEVPLWQMPVVEGMPALTRALRRAGFEVIIATTRSLGQRDQSWVWLNQHEFAFDRLICTGVGIMGKYRRVSEIAHVPGDDESVVVVEDSFACALAGGRMGWRPVLRDLPYNRRPDVLRTRPAHERQYSIERYASTADLMELMLRLQQEWKENYG